MAILESGISPSEYGLYLFAGADSMIAHTGYSSSRARVYGNNSIYVYNLSSTLLKYREGSLVSVYGGMARAITQVQPGTTLASGDNNVTIITAPNGANVRVLIQQEDENLTGWTESAIVPNMDSEDLVSDDGDKFLSIPILMGNLTVNEYSRVVRNENAYPYNSWGDSDEGIPQISPEIAQITDLERTSN